MCQLNSILSNSSLLGLGNKFMSHIREVDSIFQVLLVLQDLIWLNMETILVSRRRWSLHQILQSRVLTVTAQIILLPSHVFGIWRFSCCCTGLRSYKARVEFSLAPRK